MNTDRNLLLGVLALESDLIDARQFVEACVLWTSRKHTPLLDLMIERGWIIQDDKTHLEYFLHRKLQKQSGDARASPAAIPDELKQSLGALDDPDIPESSTGRPCRDIHAVEQTLAYAPRADKRYELIQLHATGGIGRIWVAHDKVLNREVALKDLRPEVGDNSDVSARFLQEARITGQLEHPGIVPVYELSQRSDSGEPFYTMRFVSGRTLAQAAKDYHQSRAGAHKSFDFLALLNAFVAVCRTIAYAHSRGFVHRDLKGQNVVLGGFGEVIVLDWGLAKQMSADDSDSGEPIDLDYTELASPNLTIQGQALGTPAYMAPEQAAGHLEQISHRTDIYGLGAMLYEILTGTTPFTGSDSKEVLHRIQHEQILPPAEIWREVPRPLASACMRALAKEPDQRFASANDLAQAVEQWQEIERKRAQVALETSEALYHSLVETIPMNVWRKDAEYRFSFANKGFCEATGRTLRQLLGKTDFDLFPHALAEKYRRDDAQVMSTGRTIDAVEEHETAEGQKLFVRVIKLPIRDPNGTVVGTQGIFWDITDRKRLEEALALTTEELRRARASYRRRRVTILNHDHSVIRGTRN